MSPWKNGFFTTRNGGCSWWYCGWGFLKPCTSWKRTAVNIPLFCLGFNQPFCGAGFRNHPQYHGIIQMNLMISLFSAGIMVSKENSPIGYQLRTWQEEWWSELAFFHGGVSTINSSSLVSIPFLLSSFPIVALSLGRVASSKYWYFAKFMEIYFD